MATIGLSITKSVAFRNSTQEFSNVYYYSSAGSLPDNSQADAIIDALTAIEKTFHSTSVTFVRGRLWSQAGSPGANEMISQKNLSGTGARTVQSGLDKERAFLFRLRAGVDSRGNPVYLRKWYHACGQFVASQAIGTSIVDNSSGFSASEKTAQEGVMDTIRSVTAGGSTWSLIAKSGRNPGIGETFKAHNYLEHHQMGDMWRAQ